MNDGPEKPKPPRPNGDAGRGEVALYAFGNVEASLADQFFNILNNVMVVAMHVNPLLIGLILGIKTLWDAVTDPIMAWITDNTRSRWGRRRPYILVGGVLRIALLVGIVALMPSGGHLTGNRVMEAQKYANEAVQLAAKAHHVAVEANDRVAAGAALGELEVQHLRQALAEARTAQQNASAHLPTLREDAAARAAELVAAQTALEGVSKLDYTGKERERRLELARGRVTAAEGKTAKADELIANTLKAWSRAVAAEHVIGGLIAVDGRPALTPAPRDATLAAAMRTFSENGLEPVELFSIERKPPPKPSAKKGILESITGGIHAFMDPVNAAQRSLILYVLVAFLLFTTLTTVQSVPYYALGIELSPSYDGRTQVVVYRSIMNKVAGLVTPWVPVFCFSVWFTDALDGLFWLAVGACAIGIPSTVLMCWFVRERTHYDVRKHRGQASFFASMWQIARNRHFLKIAALYVFIGLTHGLFQQIGFFLNVYWVMGSALAGAKLGAGIAMLAWAIGLATLPLINWACRRFGKHRVLQAAIVWMSIGTALKWWAMNPDHPEYQFILPFFFSVGIGSVYAILPTMMADVTDVDELRHGMRREGMFGAVMAFIMKTLGTFTPIAAGVVLVIAGLDPALEYEQAAETITRMRLLYSFVPAGMLLLALLLLYKYPLTAAKVAEIKAELARRHAAEEQG